MSHRAKIYVYCLAEMLFSAISLTIYVCTYSHLQDNIIYKIFWGMITHPRPF